MKLYKLIDQAGGTHVVLAPTIPAAVHAWAKEMIFRYGVDSGWTMDDEPEAIELLTMDPLIEAKP